MSVVVAASTILAAVCARAAEGQPEAPDSVYADKLLRLERAWPAVSAGLDPSPDVQIVCIATAGADAYVGIRRRARIQAPIAAVEAVLDDIPHYTNLFPGTADVHLVSGSIDSGRFVTAWEQRVPVPFVPNVRYELSHRITRWSPALLSYRYRLRASESLTASDGLVVLESPGGAFTQLTEYSFFDARPNPVPTSIVWRRSVQGALKAIVSVKTKAENPAWSYERITKEAEQFADRASDRIDACLKERHAHRLDDDAQPQPQTRSPTPPADSLDRRPQRP